MNCDAVTPQAPRDTGFLGHPKGLFFLAFTEAWERFSFYGMTALVVLYMVDQLLLPGNAEHIAGIAGFRAALESIFGPLSTQALASEIYGLYAAFVYFTPLLGGIVADRWIGQRNAVVLGALMMCGGHLAMAFDQTFLAALLLLVMGSGLLKGNISAQVGALYPPDDDRRRAHGFIIFSTGINIGAVLGPLFCGLVAQVYGWHYGFSVAAVFMFLGLVTYLYGYRYLPARVARIQRHSASLTAGDWRRIGGLSAVIVISVLPTIAFYQVTNVAPVWTQQHVAPNLGALRIPVPWYLSINALFSILGVPLLLWIWRRQAAHGGEPDEIAKIGVGSSVMGVSNLILVAATMVSRGEAANPIWPFLYSAGLGIGFLYYWPTLLSLVSRAAPARVNATMMGFVFISLFVANNLIGWVGGFYESMGPLRFWLLHALIGAVGGLLAILFRRNLNRILRSSVQD
jgi:POT family proton-dependent oligopeptide transporter